MKELSPELRQFFFVRKILIDIPQPTLYNVCKYYHKGV